LLLPAPRLLLRALLRYAVLLVTLGLLRGLGPRALRFLLDALLLLLRLLPWLHALLGLLLDALRLLAFRLWRCPLLALRRLLLHSLLRRLRGTLWLLPLRRLRSTLRLLLGRRLLRPLRPLWLDVRLWLCPLRLLFLHSLLRACRGLPTFRLLRALGMLLLTRPAALLLTLFVFLVLRVHW
jgi:hypothetical protein